MGGDLHVFTSAETLDLTAALAFVSTPAMGAVLPFIGIVRETNAGRPVSGVTYDVYEPLATREMTRIAEEAQAASPVPLRLWFAHIQGHVPIGGASVIIAVGSPARGPAFDACRFMIEQLKQRVPIWKQEHYTDGPPEWLPGFTLGQGQARPV